MNRLLKNELESIENMIMEKQRICDQNQLLIADKQSHIDQLIA
jgi:hypothetical protein